MSSRQMLFTIPSNVGKPMYRAMMGALLMICCLFVSERQLSEGLLKLIQDVDRVALTIVS